MDKKKSRRVNTIFLLLSSIILLFAIISTEAAGVVISGSAPKYIFLFIGDGMGYEHINITERYLSVKKMPSLAFTKIKTKGSVATGCLDYSATDSSAAITAILSGNKTNFGYLNTSPDGSVSYETIAEKLKKQKNYKIGIVTSQYINHATPAGMYAHQDSRYNFYDIGLEIINSGFDFIAGGDFLYRRGESGMADDIHEVLRNNGYNVANDLSAVNKQNKNIVINPFLAADGTIPFYIDRADETITGIAELTRLGIELLEDADGFFMLVEGGKIDTGAHYNDAATVISEVIDFNEAVKVALEFYENHKNETLIIITADHETGGLTFDKEYEENFNLLDSQKTSYINFSYNAIRYRENKIARKSALQDIEDSFGLYVNKNDTLVKNSNLALTDDEAKKLREAYDLTRVSPSERITGDEYYDLYGNYDPFTIEAIRILDSRCGISWDSFYHTDANVPLFAKGKYSKFFKGDIENTDIFKILCKILKVK